MAEIPKQEKSIYQMNGYRDREHYLRSLANEHGVDLENVKALAEILGPDEDFDGLVSNVEDCANGMGR